MNANDIRYVVVLVKFPFEIKINGNWTRVIESVAHICHVNNVYYGDTVLLVATLADCKTFANSFNED